jgi:hypothetical protein
MLQITEFFGDATIISVIGILSKGDVSIQENEIYALSFAETVNKIFASVLVGAETIRATGNYMKEEIGKAYFSLLTYAKLMNCATCNQGWHCISPLVNKENTQAKLIDNNQSLFDKKSCDEWENKVETLLPNIIDNIF